MVQLGLGTHQLWLSGRDRPNRTKYIKKASYGDRASIYLDLLRSIGGTRAMSCWYACTLVTVPTLSEVRPWSET